MVLTEFKDTSMKLTLILTLMFCFITTVDAAEKRAYKDIPFAALTAETQAEPVDAGDNHIAIAWWVTYEYWASIFARDQSMDEAIRAEVLQALEGYGLIGVVQADISMFGAFNFYDKQQVADHMYFKYTNERNESQVIPTSNNISNDLKLMLEQIKPSLEAALGNMGTHFYIFVVDDKNPDGSRLLDPYKTGQLEIGLQKKSGQKMVVQFNSPLNSLFVPKICPNGKPAHISWNYCPWSGKKL